MVNTGELIDRFRGLFPGTEPVWTVRAPGRVNLIGEHTDYNDGFVLPMAMSQALHVAAGPAADDLIAVHSTAYGQTVSFPAADPGPPGEPFWSNYPRGVAEMLRREGVRPRPGRLLIHSEVPLGGGVSSSAALEVGCALAMLALAGQSLDPVRLAMLARRAEHEYAGSPCGIMDQFICVLGRAGHALLLDCRTQTFEHVPLPLADRELLVVNTQVRHELGSSEYPVRQRQCRAGLEHIRRIHPEVRSLRDVTPAMLKAVQRDMDELTFDRCWHVVTEIERTRRAAEALREGDLPEFGRLMYGSHFSLSGKYGVSCPELDAVVEIARGVPGVDGARMTGGGFGGCAIVLAHREAEPALRAALARDYDRRFAHPALVYATRAADGASVARL